jgi:hypothetical protein
MHIPAPRLPPPVINTGHKHTTTHPDVLHIQISRGMEDFLAIDIPCHGVGMEDFLAIDIPWHGKMSLL